MGNISNLISVHYTRNKIYTCKGEKGKTRKSTKFPRDRLTVSRPHLTQSFIKVSVWVSSTAVFCMAQWIFFYKKAP